MRDVDAAVRRHRLRHLDQLLRARVVARRIDQRRADAERAVLHRAAHDGAHGVELRGVRLADRLPLRVHAHGRGAEERADVRRCAVRLHRVEPRPEAVRAGIRAGALRAAGRELATRGGLLVRRRRRPSFAEDLGGDALRHLAHRPAVAEEVRAALDVDESRRRRRGRARRCRCFAGKRRSDPAGPTRAMRSPAMATSPRNQAAPVPSITRPFSSTTSNAACGLGAPVAGWRAQAARTRTTQIRRVGRRVIGVWLDG